jgi:hypothetical protein
MLSGEILVFKLSGQASLFLVGRGGGDVGIPVGGRST